MTMNGFPPKPTPSLLEWVVRFGLILWVMLFTLLNLAGLIGGLYYLLVFGCVSSALIVAELAFISGRLQHHDSRRSARPKGEPVVSGSPDGESGDTRLLFLPYS